MDNWVNGVGSSGVFPDCICPDFLPCGIQLGLFMFGSCSDAGSLPGKSLATLQVEPLCWPSRYPALLQLSSVAQSCLTHCDPMDCSTPGLPVYHQPLEFTQTHVHWVGDAIQPSHPLSSPFPPAFNLSQHQDLFKWVSSSHQVAKDQSFSFSISPSNEYSGLISFRMDWLDPLAVWGTLKSLLQHHTSEASILQHLAFFIVQFYIGLCWSNPTLGIWACMYTHLI